MRSELVFAAQRKQPNRYMLCRVLATATRRFHKPATRIEDTTDAILRQIASSPEESIAKHLPAVGRLRKLPSEHACRDDSRRMPVVKTGSSIGTSDTANKMPLPLPQEHCTQVESSRPLGNLRSSVMKDCKPVVPDSVSAAPECGHF